MDTAQTPEDRARDLVGRLTLEEKVSQTLDEAVGIPSLGIAPYGWWNEALHGVARNGVATVFPQAVGLAATWDTQLLRRVGDVIATEARAKHNQAIAEGSFRRYSGLTFWSPNINIFRDPRWGRGQETYGEDPFLTARMGVAFVQGLQGDDPKFLKLVATPKHYAVHSGPEKTRHSVNVDPSAHDLEDTCLPAFRAAITEGKADSIMCAYNAVDGKPACASDLLLDRKLRGDWKFNGFVVSDCDAVSDVYRGHHYKPDGPGAAAASLKAGTDLDCGRAYNALVEAVKTHQLSEAELDQAVVRLFTARFRLGMFDPTGLGPFDQIGMAENDSAAHRALALQAARESVVLLKNKGGALPLKARRKILVVGPTADLLQVLEGNYNGTASAPVTPLAGMKAQFGAANVSYSPGSALAENMRLAVPSSVFHGPDGGAGLKGEYFDNPGFGGSPKVVRVDSSLDFNWNQTPPAPGLPLLNVSIRWTGTITAPAAGHYTFAFRGLLRPPSATPARPVTDPTGENLNARAQNGLSSSFRMYLDDKPVLNSEEGRSTFEFDFADGRPHPLKIEYVRAAADRDTALEWIAPARALLDPAVQAAGEADVVVAFVGLSRSLEGEEMRVSFPGFDGGDRTSLDLPEPQEKLIEAIKATGKPLIVILTSGSAVALNWADQNADAVLQAWYPGEAGGTAIAETLAGANNPSGRLPVTFYRAAGDLPAFEDYSMANRTYRYFNGPVLYPFGMGLSYTKFAYGHLTLSRPSLQAGEDLIATAEVRNTGATAGDEVVELYLRSPADDANTHPFLAGFARVHLEGGESQKVSIPLGARQLSRVDRSGRRSIVPGSYTLFAGGGQPAFSTGARATLQVTGSADLPK